MVIPQTHTCRFIKMTYLMLTHKPFKVYVTSVRVIYCELTKTFLEEAEFVYMSCSFRAINRFKGLYSHILLKDRQ